MRKVIIVYLNRYFLNEGIILCMMKKNYFLTFLKGMLVGVCDLIPGISGGTILFITGIYERFIDGLKNGGIFIKELIKLISRKNSPSFKKILRLLDFELFIPLILGIWLVYAFGSKIVLDLIGAYPAQVYSFFIGMVFASAYVVFKHIKSRRTKEAIFGIIGFGLGILISSFTKTSGSVFSLWYVLILGFVSICAMILPGISGSYILLVLGGYEFMLGVLHDIIHKWHYALAFAIGSVIGLLTFSKLIAWLLKKHHSMTLSVLTGLMLGAIIGPLKQTLGKIPNTGVLIPSIVLLFIGIASVIVIDYFARDSKELE